MFCIWKSIFLNHAVKCVPPFVEWLELPSCHLSNISYKASQINRFWLRTFLSQGRVCIPEFHSFFFFFKCWMEGEKVFRHTCCPPWRTARARIDHQVHSSVRVPAACAERQCQKPISPLHPSSAATSCCALGKSAHLALMYDSNQAGAEPWRSVTCTRASFSSSSSSPTLHWLLYWLGVTSKVRTESLKIKKTDNSNTVESLRSHSASSLTELCEEDERKWRWSHHHQSISTFSGPKWLLSGIIYNQSLS